MCEFGTDIDADGSHLNEEKSEGRTGSAKAVFWLKPVCYGTRVMLDEKTIKASGQRIDMRRCKLQPPKGGMIQSVMEEKHGR